MYVCSPMVVLFVCLIALTGPTVRAMVVFERAFAPGEGRVKPQEAPFRGEVCLNGRWQFQPVALPAGFRRGETPTPDLPLPVEDAWEQTAIRIPSPWNVNRWGAGRRGRDVGEGTSRPYDPDSEYFPSYPHAWDDVQMGWLRRTFRVPRDWEAKRLVLHFEAVAGEFCVLVNGVAAGTHFDSYLPAEFDITALVRRDNDNELLVGVRHPHLFDRKSKRYSKFSAPYPPGSNTDALAGIWQDVFLLGLPAVRVAEVFIQPDLQTDRLDVVVTLRNDSAVLREIQVGADAHPWINLAGTSPEPSWQLGAPALTLPFRSVRLASGANTNVVLTVQPDGRLKTWSPDMPNLYGLVLSLRTGGEACDVCCERFGWRQVTLHGRQVRLNGKPIQMFGDLCHPFGPFMMSRRFAWAWCRMVKDCGGNALRPHAQPYPRCYLDVADELGILVLDETAMFGSSIRLNPEVPEFWERYARHYEGLIRRDRNHPCVFGWSFGNEMFAIPALNRMSEADTADYYAKLTETGLRGRDWDPTRAWLSCDGDGDLNGALPVWSKHYGHNVPVVSAPNKPWMVGESGGTYYASPQQLAVFNGDRAYENYRGRNEALAIDLYQNIVKLALPSLAYFSPSELVWFGLEPLPLGRRDFTQLPTLAEGVHFGPFVEGRPGMQPERLPPYCSTLNPGWDPDLPLYRPLAMFDAMKAALDPRGPQPCAWDRFAEPSGRAAPATTATVARVAFIGDDAGLLARRLMAWGVPVVHEQDASFVIVDADTLLPSAVARARRALDSVRTSGGVAVVMAGGGARSGAISGLLPVNVRLTERPATALMPDREHPWTSGFTLPQLYFAADGADRFIMRHGAEGAFVEQGRVLLRAGETDWSLFNNVQEVAKTGAVMLYEQLEKPSGAALVAYGLGKGHVVLCTLDYCVTTPAADRLWRGLLARMGIMLGDAQESLTPAFNDEGAWINALSIGRFGASNLAAAAEAEFISPAAAPPRTGAKAGDCAWAPVTSPSRDRFVLRELKQAGPEKAFAVYFSGWLKSPRDLDSLLTGGPDTPHVTVLCYVSERGCLFLNGRLVQPARTEPVDYRTLLVFDDVPLKRGWNHLMFKVASTRLEGDQPATLAARLLCNRSDFLRQLETAVEINAGGQ